MRRWRFTSRTAPPWALRRHSACAASSSARRVAVADRSAPLVVMTPWRTSTGSASVASLVAGCRVGVVGRVDVEPVRLAASGGHHVERFADRRRADVGVRRVDGPALRAVGGAWRSRARRAPARSPRAARATAPPSARRTRIDAVLVDGLHDPVVAVLDPPAPGHEGALVVPGHDDVAHADRDTVAEPHARPSATSPTATRCARARAFRSRDGLGVGGEHQRRPPGASRRCSQPSKMRSIMSSRLPDSTRPCSTYVAATEGRPARSSRRGGAFPLVPEPAHVVQRWRVPPRVGEQLERAPGLHRRQLRPVPHQQHLRARLAWPRSRCSPGPSWRPSTPRRRSPAAPAAGPTAAYAARAGCRLLLQFAGGWGGVRASQPGGIRLDLLAPFGEAVGAR